jgi:UDP-N-acetylmuramate dehydrogenase
MQNATAVLAAATELGHDTALAAAELSHFAGVGRRFELIGEVDGVQVVDDYGHHPTEVRATLAAAKARGYRHVHLLFQPHRYTRTYRLFDQFVDAFNDVDTLTMLDLYSAGEDPIDGISSQILIDAINTKYPERDAYLVNKENAAQYMAALASPGDIVLTLGAGDVTNIAPQIVEALRALTVETEIYTENEPEQQIPVASADASTTELKVTSGWTAPIFEAYCELEGNVSGSLIMNEPMARHTSFRIGGAAALFVECATLADLKLTLEVIKRYGLSWVVVGKGTNLLVSDRGFEGVVITLGREFKNQTFPELDEADESLFTDMPASSEQAVEYPGEIVVAGAGVQLGNLVREAFKNGFSGLEFAVGIPGTLGGAIFMNAGSAEEWISRIVSSVLVLKADGKLVRYAKDDLPWAYRSSGLQIGDIVLEAELVLQRGNTGHIRARMEGILKRRQKSQPLGKPNAGSIFKNFYGAAAGQLIDALGMKGLKNGGASISDIHANFIVNDGSATAEDVITLIQEIRKRVLESYGFKLQTEIRFIGF